MLEFTDDNFEAEVESSEYLVVVDFWADWCPPCNALTPTIEELAADNPDVRIGKLDIQNNPHTAATHNITSIPAILFFKDGKVVKSLLGAQKKSVFQTVIDDLTSQETEEVEETEEAEENEG